MKHKNTLVLFVIMLVLSLIAYIQLQVQENKFLPLKQEVPLFPNLNTNLTNRLEIITPTKRTVLEKQNGKWFVVSSGNYPANERLVNILFRRVNSLRTGEIVTDKHQKHSTFKVDGTGIKVKLFKDKKNLQAALYVGKTDNDYVDTYLRKEKSDQVMVIHDNIQQIFIPYEWRNHKLFYFPHEDIREVIITYPEEVVHIKQRVDGIWENQSLKKDLLDEQRIVEFLQKLSSLSSVDFARREIKPKIPDNLKIQIILKDDSVKTLVIGEAANPITLYAWILEETPVFLILTKHLDKLEKYSRQIFRR